MKTTLAVVTGAGRGIGREVALKFAENGATVVVCARTPEGIESLVEEIKASGGSAHGFICDVGDEQSVKSFIEQAAGITGEINVLVNNAGIARVNPVEKVTFQEWEETLRINLTGAFLTTQSALNYMPSGSHIFTIGSNASKAGFPNWSAYCASKWGLLGFTNSLREELRPRGIRVTSILPGPTNTPIWEDIGGGFDTSAMMDPAAVAKMVVYLHNQPPEMVTEEVMMLPQGGSL